MIMDQNVYPRAFLRLWEQEVLADMEYKDNDALIKCKVIICMSHDII